MGHVEFTFEYEQGAIIEGKQFAHAVGVILGTRSVMHRRIHHIRIGGTGLHIITKRGNHHGCALVARPEAVGGGIIRERLQREVATADGEQIGRQDETSARGRTVEPILQNGVIGLTTDVDGAIGRPKGNALLITIGQRGGSESLVPHVSDLSAHGIHVNVEDKKSVGRRFIGHHGIAPTAQRGNAAIVACGHRIGEIPLGQQFCLRHRREYGYLHKAECKQ